MKTRAVKIRRALLACLALVALLAVVLVTCDETLLCVRSELQNADAIVVLGGEPVIRAEHAARLATNGLAPLVIVSGHGDCESNRRVIQRVGVPSKRIELECASRTTQENAQLTIALLREKKCRRVIVVTSWFHSRRAVGSFRKYAPEIEFLSAPVARTKPARDERNYIMNEYLKVAGYILRYGIWPAVKA